MMKNKYKLMKEYIMLRLFIIWTSFGSVCMGAYHIGIWTFKFLNFQFKDIVIFRISEDALIHGK
jgi:hypothetical protein